MKISDLKVGMMLTPKLNRWTGTRMKFRVQEYEMTKSHNDKDPRTEKTLVCDISAIGPLSGPNIGIYMGFERSEYWLQGVKKHHRILVGDSLTRISGHDFRWIEKVEDQE